MSIRQRSLGDHRSWSACKNRKLTELDHFKEKKLSSEYEKRQNSILIIKTIRIHFEPNILPLFTAALFE